MVNIDKEVFENTSKRQESLIFIFVLHCFFLYLRSDNRKHKVTNHQNDENTP